MSYAASTTIFLSYLLATESGLAQIQTDRTWTSSDGRYSVVAEFIRTENQSAVFKTAGGTEGRVPLSRLSWSDRSWIAFNSDRATDENVPQETFDPVVANVLAGVPDGIGFAFRPARFFAAENLSDRKFLDFVERTGERLKPEDVGFSLSDIEVVGGFVCEDDETPMRSMPWSVHPPLFLATRVDMNWQNVEKFAKTYSRGAIRTVDQQTCLGETYYVGRANDTAPPHFAAFLANKRALYVSTPRMIELIIKQRQRPPTPLARELSEALKHSQAAFVVTSSGADLVNDNFVAEAQRITILGALSGSPSISVTLEYATPKRAEELASQYTEVQKGLLAIVEEKGLERWVTELHGDKADRDRAYWHLIWKYSIEYLKAMEISTAGRTVIGESELQPFVTLNRDLLQYGRRASR